MSSLSGKVDLSPVQADLTTLLARLTAGRATNLDNLPNLDAAVSGRATAAAVAALPTTPIASIQRGVLTGNGVETRNVTISAVDTAKSFVTISSHEAASAARLTSTTNLEISGVTTSGKDFFWEVIEYV